MPVSRRLGIDVDRARIVRKLLPGVQSDFMATRLLNSRGAR